MCATRLTHVVQTLDVFIRNSALRKVYLVEHILCKATRQLLRALEYCFHNGVRHGDVQAKNIGVTSSASGGISFQLLDFGISEVLRFYLFLHPHHTDLVLEYHCSTRSRQR